MKENNEWDFWKGKKVFIRLVNDIIYNGEIINIDSSSPPLVFITLIDKFGKRIQFVQSEVIKIEERGK